MTLYFWLASEQETVLGVRHLGRDLRVINAQAGCESMVITDIMASASEYFRALDLNIDRQTNR